MKRFLALLLAALMLLVTFAGCGETPAEPAEPDTQETPEPPKEPELVITEKPNVKYPELVPDEIFRDQRYQDAAAKDNVIITCEDEIVTSPAPFREYARKIETGESAVLGFIYFERQEDGIYCGESYHVFDGENHSIQDENGKVIRELCDVHFDSFGNISWKEKGHDMQFGGCHWNYRDIIKDYDMLQPLCERYIEPYYHTLSMKNEDATAEEIITSCHHVGLLDDLLWPILPFPVFHEGEPYPNGLMPAEDAVGFLLRYYEADSVRVAETVEKFLNEDGLLPYLVEPGFGGGYPKVVPAGYEEDGDIARITYRRSDHWPHETLDTQHSCVLTVRLLPDGSFRLISLEVNRDDPLLPLEES